MFIKKNEHFKMKSSDLQTPCSYTTVPKGVIETFIKKCNHKDRVAEV